MKHRRDRSGKRKEETIDKDNIEWLAGKVRMPVDVLAGAPVFFMTGRYQIWVENYKSILEYSEEQIRVQTRQGRVRIYGEILHIEEFSRDGMRIVGRINGMEFVRGEQ